MALPSEVSMGEVVRATFAETENPDPFDDFWLLYPRHVAKLDARKAFAKIDPDQHVPILTACAAWRRVWADKDQQYIPHAATWLNGERWTDELPREYLVAHASHVPIAPEPRSERAPMPEYVRAMIAKLRGK